MLLFEYRNYIIEVCESVGLVQVIDGIEYLKHDILPLCVDNISNEIVQYVISVMENYLSGFDLNTGEIL